MRFVVNTAGGGTRQLDSKDLLDLFCVATAANAATRILDGIKIKKIEMWAANSAGNASNTVQIEYLNQNAAGIGGPGTVHNDTAVGLYILPIFTQGHPLIPPLVHGLLGLAQPI